MVSYDSISLQVAPDMVRESDGQVLWVNHHFEYKKDHDYAWFNYLDTDYNFLNIELKLPRNQFGQFDKATIGEPQKVDVNVGGIKSKPNRFARYGSVAVLAFKDENALLIKDLTTEQTEVVRPTVYEKRIGQ